MNLFEFYVFFSVPVPKLDVCNAADPPKPVSVS